MVYLERGNKISDKGHGYVKASYKAILIIFALVVAMGLISLIYTHTGYRGVLTKYCVAIEKTDADKALSVFQSEKYVPGYDEGDIEEYMREYISEYHDRISSDCGNKFKVSYKIMNVVKNADSYSMIMQFQANGKEGDYYGDMEQVTVYKYENKWYMKFSW